MAQTEPGLPPAPTDAKPELPPLNYESLGEKLPTIAWTEESLVPVTSAGGSSQTTETRPLEEITAFLSNKKTSIQGEAEVKPMMTFQETVFAAPLLALIEEQKFVAPTTVQSVAWPLAMEGKDVVAIACTGSGKTLAYLMPLLHHISKQPPVVAGQGPVGLVLVPTRELAKQIAFDCNKYGKTVDVRTVCLYGGNGRQFQMKDLEVMPQLVVATPGRLLDFLENGVTNLKRCSFLVVDEGDRMMDMGFGPQLKKVLSQIRPDRQCFMCTATWPSTLVELANEYLKSPVYVNVGSVEYPLNPKIKHEVKVVEAENKLSTLVDLLKAHEGKRVLVFVDTKAACDSLGDELKAQGVDAVCLHGQKSTKDRMGALLDFRAGRKLVVIATDVASRGIDIRDLELVILFDFPRRLEDYVHRIGRTARGERSGTAISIFTKDNAKSAQMLVKVLEEAGQTVPRELRRMIRKPKTEGEAQDGKENEKPRRRRRSRSREADN
jgi:ATP-dependent RNA helicase DDX5/DBP2